MLPEQKYKNPVYGSPAAGRSLQRACQQAGIPSMAAAPSFAGFRRSSVHVESNISAMKKFHIPGFLFSGAAVNRRFTAL
ncbi:hypothetical protein [Pontibacter liquoris]|uniref:hypothetical protein n=1 Tax=Pontibacter liquoris TaxID=2905677 RepID=UPI001FA7C5EE|nr:hypothetical protein [Pontibacter liquoris]